LSDAGIETLPGPFLDFLDPWGNRIEIIGYDSIQFTKVPHVLRGMGLAHLSKNQTGIKELTDKGMAHRVGGGVTPAALPHHRTYGSVYGGS
jgi:hypothetical protein